MKKQLIILIFMMIFSIFNVHAVTTCINNGTAFKNCFDVNQNIYETGISYYEGSNDKLKMYIENPDVKVNNWIEWALEKLTPGAIQKISPTDLGDNTVVTFDSNEDFFNLLQQENAVGNVTLFSKSELYAKERDKTSELTGEVINWTYILIIMIIEFTRIIINITLVLVSIFLIFRGIPMALNFVKNMTIKFFIWSKSK